MPEPTIVMIAIKYLFPTNSTLKSGHIFKKIDVIRHRNFSRLFFDNNGHTVTATGTGKLYGSSATPDDMLSYAKRIMGDYLVLDPN